MGIGSQTARGPRRLWIGALTATGAMLGAAVVAAAAHPAQRIKSVAYLGRAFAVPASWAVVDLSARPATCVRFDVHALYIGTPGEQQNCPARGVGRRTGAMLIQPTAMTRSAVFRPVAFDHPVSAEIDASAPGVSVTATYSVADRAAVLAVLAAARMPAPTLVSPGASPGPSLSTGARSSGSPGPSLGASVSPSPSPSAAITIAPAPTPVTTAGVPTSATGVVSGVGFDACTAPSSHQMAAWTAPASPFTAVGVYIGGSERACAQSNLTAAWVSAEARAGWHFMPLYVGWQAAWDSLTQTAPATLGRQSADDAASQALALGFQPGSVLYYDMEAYSTSAKSAAAMAFLSAWTSELRLKGYRPAVYSSRSSGISDLVAGIGKTTEPDVIDVADWNNRADADPGATPASAWPRLRVHQSQGGADATYGGVKINIDRDFFALDITSCPVSGGCGPGLASP